jgi:hypothetical protein
MLNKSFIGVNFRQVFEVQGFGYFLFGGYFVDFKFSLSSFIFLIPDFLFYLTFSTN